MAPIAKFWRHARHPQVVGVMALPDQNRALSKEIDNFARTSESYFVTVEFARNFGIDPSGSTASSSIQNVALTVS